MAIEIKAPNLPGIRVATDGFRRHRKKPGEAVKRDELIVDIETDKEGIDHRGFSPRLTAMLARSSERATPF